MNKKILEPNRLAIFPGSFNPMHIGHEEIIRLSSMDYEKVYVVVAINDNKKYNVNLNQRFQIVKKFVNESNLDNVEVLMLEPGKTVPAFAEELGVENIVRGTQTQTVPIDESLLADSYLDLNKKLNFNYISFSDINVTSSQVRDRINHNESIEGMVPKSVHMDIELL